MILLFRQTLLGQFRPVSLSFLPSVSIVNCYSTSATMASLSLASKYRMHTGYEIPALGYGVSSGALDSGLIDI